MRLQNLLDLVILPDVAEPTIQLDKENAVNFSGLYILQKLLHDLALHGWLAGTVALVPVDPDDLVAVGVCVVGQDFLLGLEAVALHELFLGGDPGVQGYADNDLLICFLHFLLAFPGQVCYHKSAECPYSDVYGGFLYIDHPYSSTDDR